LPPENSPKPPHLCLYQNFATEPQFERADPACDIGLNGVEDGCCSPNGTGIRHGGEELQADAVHAICFQDGSNLN
jgi:hypothetical protein